MAQDQRTIGVGIVGSGFISRRYLPNLLRFPHLRVVACADRHPERAAAVAAEFGVGKAYGVDELLADPEIDIVLNLTSPAGHFGIALAAIEAGKAVYNEKPLAIALDDAQALLAAAERRRVLMGCAPDTFLGGGLQTCRKLIDDGVIGEPIAAMAFFGTHGPEHWHPNPAFLYAEGAGPLMDIGPYYLTALVSLIGPIRRVTGSARITFPERVIISEPLHGTVMRVKAPTHVAGILDFSNGAIGTLVTSFDIWGTTLPRIELHGTRGSLLVPDPDTFAGPVRLRRAGETEWSDVPLTHSYTHNARGVGVADLAHAIQHGRIPRASGALATHILEALHGIYAGSDNGAHVEIRTLVERPEPLSAGQPDWELD